MENELNRGTPQHFDLLLVDAFSSDAIPVHLLTRECFALYMRHLKPDGLLLINVTNRFLDLAPVVYAQAREIGCRAELIKSEADPENAVGYSDWVIQSRNEKFYSIEEVEDKLKPETGTGRAILPWTDDFASLWQILKR